MEHFDENVMNLGQLLRRCHLKILLLLALVAILFREAELFFIILVEGIMRIITVKLF